VGRPDLPDRQRVQRTVRSASTQEIEARVKELLRDARPGGGFCLGSGNSVPNWAKFENFLAMRGPA